ncbi:hypothetical protein [Erythrobacter sp. SG61-1L]|uniref:hypothetical protein n=1 Tax=Erythrobacter sp. SG61-1L TaxID=1603897 RepID=UPI0012E1D4F7|nr:hypothetical protein [Erythrobacter sp. SG61-1L]
MDLEVYPVSAVLGAAAAMDGSHILVKCAWSDGEEFILRLPLHIAEHLQNVVQMALADAARNGGGHNCQPPIVRSLALQASPQEGAEILTIEIEGGMNLHFQVPSGKYQKGILRLPDPASQNPMPDS